MNKPSAPRQATGSGTYCRAAPGMPKARAEASWQALVKASASQHKLGPSPLWAGIPHTNPGKTPWGDTSLATAAVSGMQDTADP